MGIFRFRAEAAIDDLAARIAGLLALRYAVVCAAVWGFAWGAAALVMRAALDASRTDALWGAGGLAPALALALVLAARRRPRPSALRALLDDHGHCGGLLMAGAEADLGSWTGRAARPGRVLPRWRGARHWGLLAASALFVGVAFLVPQRMVAIRAAPPFQVDRELDRLSRQIETLREERILADSAAETMKERLDQIRADASGSDPVKTLEALDHVDQANKKLAEEAGEKASAEAQRMAAAEAAANALAGAADDLAGQAQDAKDSAAATSLAQAMAGLGRLAADAALADETLREQLSSGLAKDLQAASLSPETMKALAKALGACKGAKLGKLKKLCEAGLLDPALLKDLKGLESCDLDTLVACLGQCEGDGDCDGAWAALLAQCDGGKPGRGGVSRGRADAPMYYGNESNEAGARFKPKALPPAALSGLKDASVSGVSATAPTLADDAAPLSGALGSSAAGGGQAARAPILPRHQDAVQRYFERK